MIVPAGTTISCVAVAAEADDEGAVPPAGGAAADAGAAGDAGADEVVGGVMLPPFRELAPFVSA
jgi:hypothetical protein